MSDIMEPFYAWTAVGPDGKNLIQKDEGCYKHYALRESYLAADKYTIGIPGARTIRVEIREIPNAR